jgi:serpin B
LETLFKTREIVMKGLVSLGLLMTVVFATAEGQVKTLPVSPDLAQVARDNNQFALELYARLAEKPGNRFFSPYSISNALAMTYAGAGGKTAEEMASTLHFALEPDRFHRGFGELVRALQSEGAKRKYQLRVANRLWGQKDYGFLPNFLKLSEHTYGAGLKEVDFENATEEARKTINAWVEDETNKKIKELLKPGILTVDTRLVLTNAIYFKAAWLRPFEKKATKPGDFTTADGKKVKAEMMHAHHRARFLDGGNFQALDLPYEGNELSMFVFLPKKADGLAELEKSLTIGNLEKWLPKMRDYIVDISVPKFKVTDEFLLNDVLKEMGIKLAFDARRADFSNMTSRDQLFIKHVIHKAFVDVNEAGTEAAAATAVVMEARSLPPPAIFRADHPFVYLIRDNRTGSILFLGRVTDPS